MQACEIIRSQPQNDVRTDTEEFCQLDDCLAVGVCATTLPLAYCSLVHMQLLCQLGLGKASLIAQTLEGCYHNNTSFLKLILM